MKLIPLSQGLFAQVDDQDENWLSEYNWRAVKNGQTHYALFGKRTKGKYANIWMHRMILSVTNRESEVSHIDHNGLNNQSSNLRISTHQEVTKSRNVTSNKNGRYKGVSLYQPSNRWRARICIDGKMIYLGYFEKEETAALAYNEAAIKHFGEFAHLNNINNL